jgi:hypothetical protein
MGLGLPEFCGHLLIWPRKKLSTNPGQPHTVKDMLAGLNGKPILLPHEKRSSAKHRFEFTDVAWQGLLTQPFLGLVIGYKMNALSLHAFGPTFIGDALQQVVDDQVESLASLA